MPDLSCLFSNKNTFLCDFELTFHSLSLEATIRLLSAIQSTSKAPVTLLCVHKVSIKNYTYTYVKLI